MATCLILCRSLTRQDCWRCAMVSGTMMLATDPLNRIWMPSQHLKLTVVLLVLTPFLKNETGLIVGVRQVNDAHPRNSSDHATFFHCSVVQYYCLVLSVVDRGQHGHADWSVPMHTQLYSVLWFYQKQQYIFGSLSYSISTVGLKHGPAITRASISLISQAANDTDHCIFFLLLTSIGGKKLIFCLTYLTY